MMRDGVKIVRDAASEERPFRGSFSSLTAVTFRFPGSLVPRARRVASVGPFNEWNAAVHQTNKERRETK